MERKTLGDTKQNTNHNKTRSMKPGLQGSSHSAYPAELTSEQKKLPKSPTDLVTCEEVLHVLTVLRGAHDSLKNSSPPTEIRCRSSEYSRIIDFLYRGLIDNTSQAYCMIITGKPGSGKTLLVNNILQKLKSQGKNHLIEKYKELRNLAPAQSMKPSDLATKSPKEPKPEVNYTIHVISLNAVNYLNCISLLMEVVNKMFVMSNTKYDSDLNSQNGDFLLVVLNKYLDKIMAQNSFVLMVDELDTLFTHDKQNSHFIVQLYKIARERFLKIGISNTIDLGAKEKGKTMELDGVNLCFKPYTDDHMLQIAEERLERALAPYHCKLEDFFSQTTLRTVCKLGNRDAQGDIRKILENLRNVLESKITELSERVVENFPNQSKLLCGDLALVGDGSSISGKHRSVLTSSRISNSASSAKPVPLLRRDLMMTQKDGYKSVQTAENCANPDSDIVSSLGTNAQVCLLGIYLALTTNSTVVQMSELSANLSIVRMALGEMTLKDTDIPLALEALQTYNLIKPLGGQSSSKLTGKVKTNYKSNSTQMRSFSSTHAKEALKKMLWEVEAFRGVLESDTKEDPKKAGDQSNLTADSYTQTT